MLASILTAKGIPNELRMSFDHIWVDYPGKQANALENAGVVLAGRQRRPLLPPLAADFHLGQEVADQMAIFWTPAPLVRVLLLLAAARHAVAPAGVAGCWQRLRVCVAGWPATAASRARPRRARPRLTGAGRLAAVRTGIASRPGWPPRRGVRSAAVRRPLSTSRKVT